MHKQFLILFHGIYILMYTAFIPLFRFHIIRYNIRVYIHACCSRIDTNIFYSTRGQDNKSNQISSTYQLLAYILLVWHNTTKCSTVSVLTIVYIYIYIYTTTTTTTTKRSTNGQKILPRLSMSLVSTHSMQPNNTAIIPHR